MEGDVGAGRAYRSFGDTLSLYKNAAVLTHQRTVRKCWRFYQGPQDFYMPCLLLLGIGMPVAGLSDICKLMIKWNDTKEV